MNKVAKNNNKTKRVNNTAPYPASCMDRVEPKVDKNDHDGEGKEVIKK